MSKQIDVGKCRIKVIEKKASKGKKIALLGKIGEKSVYGEIVKACYLPKCSQEFVIKRIPLNSSDSVYLNTSESPFLFRKSGVLKELYINKLVTELVINKICPHFLVSYLYYTCKDVKDCGFEDKKTLSPNIKGCALLVSEKQDKTFKIFLSTFSKEYKSDINSNLLIFSSLFQIFTGIYSLQKYFNIIHNDLHWDNVMYKYSKNVYESGDKACYEYIINGESILIPYTKYLFVIIDFGLSTITKKITPKNQWVDFIRISSMLGLDDLQKNKDIDKISRLFSETYFNKFKNPQDFILYLGRTIMTKFLIECKGKYKVMHTFNLDKKLENEIKKSFFDRV